MVMFIHRPEYYGIQTDQDGNSLKGVAEIIVAKHRNGAIGDFHLSFKAHLARFSDLESAQDESSISNLHDPQGRNGVSSPIAPAPPSAENREARKRARAVHGG